MNLRYFFVVLSGRSKKKNFLPNLTQKQICTDFLKTTVCPPFTLSRVSPSLSTPFSLFHLPVFGSFSLFFNFFSGEIILSSLKTIENELKKELETFFKISELNYDLYWYILRISRKSAESSSENSLHVEVLGIRHKFSFKMYEGKENDLVQDTVKKTGFCFAL